MLISGTSPLPANIVVRHYSAMEIIFSQGDRADRLCYLQEGAVKLTVVSKQGREAVILIARPSEFFGECCLAGRTSRICSAKAIDTSTVALISKDTALRLLHDNSAFEKAFVIRLLSLCVHLKENLADHITSNAEKRLARVLWLHANTSSDGRRRVITQLNQQTLASMVGTTRPRISLFLKNFRQLGHIEYIGSDHSFLIHDSLLNILR